MTIAMRDFTISLAKKPKYREFSIKIDFFQFFKFIEDTFENCFFLESLGESGTYSRYSIIGFMPDGVLIGKNEKLLYMDSRKQISEVEYKAKNPYYALQLITPQSVISRQYAGGLVGYLSYDCVNYFEETLNLKPHEKFSQFKFGIYKDGFIFDKLTGQIFYFYYDSPRDKTIEEQFHVWKEPSYAVSCSFTRDTLTKEEHKNIVNLAKEKIVSGHIFQVEVGFKSEYTILGRKIPLYESLRLTNPSPFMYYVKFGEEVIIGASPELLFSLRNKEMETYPLAGTTKRGSNEIEDRLLAKELLQSKKEIAEHCMLIDLHRNDLGRVSEYGTVKVRSYMDIKKLTYVQHIASEIVGIIKKGEDSFSALAANFPMGTVTGAPKIEAMKIIDEHEPEGRGPYAGGIGHFGFNGNCTFAVALRTLFTHGTYGYIQTCGGNVYDSDPNDEYEEIQRKLRGMRTVLEQFKAE
jgi:anthranilate synthase component I